MNQELFWHRYASAIHCH